MDSDGAYDPESYGKAFADVYDEWYSDLDDADFVAHAARLLPMRDSRVLELGAGTGRLIAALQAERQLHHDHFVALDASPAMLAHLEARGLPRVVPWCSDMTARAGAEIPPNASTTGPFDLVIIGYNTIFNVPDTYGLRRCMENVVSWLGSDGYFTLDAVVPRGTEGEEISVKYASGARVVLSVSNHDAGAQRIRGEFLEFENDECVRRRPWSVRYFSPTDIDAVARDVGLELVHRHADGHGTPFAESSSRHVSTYRRSRR